MGSETSDRALPLQGAYSASKHAVKGFSDSLRAELEEEQAPVAVTLIKPGSVDTMFVSHAANYLASEPRLPPPIYAPELVADALLHAAVHPSRELYVGGHAKLMGTAAHYAPGALERGLGRFMANYVPSGRPGRNRNDHALYVARTDLRERGKQDWPTHEHSLYTRAAMHPGAMRAAALTGVALLTLWQARRRR
jgi:NAD(P)-dependent dehydrogenase (short-subunit alcohol dehydrogenase family)